MRSLTQKLRSSALSVSVLVSSALFPALHGAITWQQAMLGNIFNSNETVSIPLKATGTDLSWVVRDFSGDVVKQGSAKVTNGTATLQPSVNRMGYFELEVTETKNGSTVSTAKTSFAVLSQFDASKVKNSPFGVQTHFAQTNSPEVMPVLAKAGIAHIRDEHFWESIEKTKGTYTIPTQFTNFMSAAKTNNLSPLLILGWSNPFYDYSKGRYTAPHTDAGREGFANYARALVRNYGTQLQALEVWNEYNAGTYVQGPATTDKALSYTELLKAVYPKIKSERPDVQILAGAGVPVPHGFFRDLFEDGAMPYLDVITVHPYRVYPDGVQSDIAQLRSLIKSYNGGKEKPIWATEFSMNITNPEQQYDAAVYLAQIVPLLLSEKVERIYYYLCNDDSLFKERGLLTGFSDARGRFTPKPTYVAYANSIRQLANTTFHSRFEGTAASTYAFKFMQGSAPVNVLWSTQTIKVTVKATGALTCTDIMGQVTTINPVNGSATIELSPEVQYVRGNITAVSDGSSVLLADALAGYSDTQGKNGWSYGTVAVGTGSYDYTKFTAMTWKVWAGDNFRWCGASQYNFINVDQMHPTSAWSVRRWTSTVDGTVALTGEASRPATQGDGVDIYIFVDGVQVHKATVAPGKSIDYELLSVKVKKGSLVDFVISPRGESSFDATKFTASIIKG